MSRRLLTRGWAVVGCACLATVTGAASCSSTAGSGTTITGSTLSIYQSVAPGSRSREAQDVLDAEKLAFQQAGGKVGKFKLKLVPASGQELSDNARQGIADSTTIAYLGEFTPGASADTIGITNAENILQVSPTDTAVELTQSTPAISDSPQRYYESLGTNGRTFARLVPTDELEAKAVVTQMQAMAVKRLYIATDGSAYGKALRAALIGAAKSPISSVSAAAGADAVFYAGSSAAGATAVFNRAAAGSSKVALFAPSALAQDSFAASLSPAAQKDLTVSSPGFTAGDLPPAGRQFVAAFRAAYGHEPATQAIFGYTAVEAVIRALQKAGSSATNRSTVVHDFFGLTNFSSPVGSISIDKNGDVNLGAFVFSRVRGGRLVPVKAVQEQG